MVAGTEPSNIIDEYEENMIGPSLHNHFVQNEKDFIQEFHVTGITFLDKDAEMLNIESPRSEDAVYIVNAVEVKGKEQY